ncbi:MAG: hypothetical protein QOF76_4547, partial [Solirubrobacteraceae bacterium]|nr:hypothetical protein [Solirubrobacteraceae bacterium]
QSDGRLVAVGDAQTGEPSFQCGATRLNPSGATDTTFGTNGIAKITLGKTCYPAGAALQADGRILITGTTTDGFNFAGTSNAALGRFTTGGQPDATFAPGGAAPVGVGGVASFGNAIVVQGGKPLIAGGSGSPQHVFALGRFAGGDLAGGGVTPTPTVTTTATATATVTPAPGAPTSPHVAGHPETGATLYCDPGSLTGDLSYAWFMVGGDGSASQIGTGSTLRVPSKAEGFFVECFVVQAGTSFGTASDNRVKIVERAVLPLFPSFTRALRNYLPGTKVCGNKGFCTDDEVRQDLEKLGTNLNWKTPDTVEHAHQVPKELRNDVAPGAVIDVGVSPGSAKQFSSGPGKPVTVKTTVFDPHIFSPNVCPFNVDLTSVGEQEFQLQDLLPGQSLSDARKLLRQLKCFRLNSEGDEIHSQYRVDLHTKKNVEQPIVTHAAIQRDDNAPGHRVYALDVDVPPADLVLDIQPTVGKTPTLGLADAALTAATKQATSFDVHVSTTVGIGAQHLAVDLRDREGALIDTQKTDPNGTAHFASVVDTPGLYELSTTLIDGDGDALAGYEPIRAVNRKGAQFTDLAGARWTAGGAGKPYSKAGARRAGAPLAHLSATEASNATLIQEQGKAMYAALFNSYCPQLPSGRYACEDNAFRAGLFGGTPEQVQFATQGMRLALETLLIIARDGVLTSDIHTRVSVVTIGGNGTLALATGQTVTVPTLQFDGKTVRTGLADGFVPGTGGLHIESDGFQVFPGGTWIVAQGGGNIISNDGGSLSAKTVDAAARRGFDIQAANIISDNGGGIARNGGSIISDNGGGLAVHGGNIISDHAAGILAQPGTQLIAAPGGAIVAQGGGNIISNDGGSR